MSLPAYIYARFSTQEQVKGHSLKRQLVNARQRIFSDGWEYPGLDQSDKDPDFSIGAKERDLTDQGKSAYSGANRQPGGALYEFERKAKLGHFRNGAVLVVEHVDRLTRQGWKEALDILTDLTSNGVSVAIIQNNRLFRAGERITMQDAMMVVLESELSREESEKKAKRLRESWGDRIQAVIDGDKKALSKLPPRWIEVDPKTSLMRLHPHRGKVVVEIFEWYVGGFGLPKIVEMLNARGEPSWAYKGKDKGNGWNTAYLHKILNNRAVMGEFEPMSRTHGGINETSKGIRVPDYYPQAVTPELFNRAQAQRATRQRFGGGQVNKLSNLFAGLVHCEHCRAPMYLQSQQKKGRIVTHKSKLDGRPLTHIAGGDRSYLMCNNRRRSNQVNLGGGEMGQCRNSGKPRYEHLEKSVLDTVLTLAMDNVSFSMPDNVAELEAQLAEHDRQTEGKRFTLSNLLASQKVRFTASVAHEIGDLEDEIAADEAAAKDMRRELEREKGQASPEEHLQRVREVLTSLDSPDDDVRYEARLRVMQALRQVVRMTCDKDGVTTVMLTNELMAWRFDKNGNLLGSIDNRQRLDLHKGILSAASEGHVDAVLRRSPEVVRQEADPSEQQWKKRA